MLTKIITIHSLFCTEPQSFLHTGLGNQMGQQTPHQTLHENLPLMAGKKTKINFSLFFSDFLSSCLHLFE